MKKSLLGIFLLLFVFIFLTIGFFVSPLGEKVIQRYIINRLCLTDKLQPTFFNYTFDSFSLILKKDNNLVQIFGNLYPLNAVYSANFNNINTLWPYLKGKLHSTGSIKTQNQETFLEGNIVTAKGFGKVNLKCNKNFFKGSLNLQKLDTFTFLSMIKDFKLPFFKGIPFEGRSNLKLTIDNPAILEFFFNGNVLINSYKIPSKIYVSMNLNTINDFSFRSIISSNDIKGIIKGNEKNSVLSFNADFNYFNLKFLQNLLLYPLKSKIPLNINYTSDSDIVLFKSSFLNGDFKKGTFNIQFKTDSETFFKVLSLNEIIKGDVSGNIYIDDLKEKGTFNILFANASFNSLPLIKKIERKTGINLENSKGIFFFNGEFNKKRIVFNLISKDQKYIFIIKNGIYDYSGVLSINIKISSPKKEVYLNVFNNKIKVLNINYKNKPTETLVF